MKNNGKREYKGSLLYQRMEKQRNSKEYKSQLDSDVPLFAKLSIGVGVLFGIFALLTFLLEIFPPPKPHSIYVVMVIGSLVLVLLGDEEDE